MRSAISSLEEKRRRSHQDVDLNDDNPLHPLKDSTLRFFKRPMEEGTSLIAVPLTSSSSTLSAFPTFSGNLSSFEHPEIFTSLSNFKIENAAWQTSKTFAISYIQKKKGWSNAQLMWVV